MSMLTEISWKEFKDAGALWLTNRFLHLFGLAIVVEYNDETNEIIRAYPARCKFRGFSPEADDKGFKLITNYLKNNIDDLEADILL